MAQKRYSLSCSAEHYTEKYITYDKTDINDHDRDAFKLSYKKAIDFMRPSTSDPTKYLPLLRVYFQATLGHQPFHNLLNSSSDVIFHGPMTRTVFKLQKSGSNHNASNSQDHAEREKLSRYLTTIITTPHTKKVPQPSENQWVTSECDTAVSQFIAIRAAFSFLQKTAQLLLQHITTRRFSNDYHNNIMLSDRKTTVEHNRSYDWLSQFLSDKFS